MKRFLNIIIAASAAILTCTALMISAAEFSGSCSGETGTETQSADNNILKDSGFTGFIAYNALNGTSEQIGTADRQVLVFRNSFNGTSLYQHAASKRQVSLNDKWHHEAGITHSFPERYYIMHHNVELLDRGMSSNSERIHLLRLLLI